MIFFEKLPEKDLEEVQDVLDALLSKGFIRKTRYNATTNIEKDNPLFVKCQKHEHNLRLILETLRYELMYESHSNVFYVESSRKEESFSREATYILVALKRAYEMEMSRLSARRVSTTRKELRILASDMGLLTEKMKNNGIWSDVLGYLKARDILTYPGAAKDITDETPIYINNTIDIIMSGSKMGTYCKECEGITT